MARVYQTDLNPVWLKLQEGWRVRKRRQRLKERMAREAAALHPEGYVGPVAVPQSNDGGQPTSSRPSTPTR